MAMHAWVTHDDQGREVLLREGMGVVTAVVGIGDADEPAVLYRIEIECERPMGRARSIRYSVHGLVEANGPLVVEALDAQALGQAVAWTIQWTRHSWIPDHLPIASLDLASDARAAVLVLTPVGAKERANVVVDDTSGGA